MPKIPAERPREEKPHRESQPLVEVPERESAVISPEQAQGVEFPRAASEERPFSIPEETGVTQPELPTLAEEGKRRTWSEAQELILKKSNDSSLSASEASNLEEKLRAASGSLEEQETK